MNKCIKKRKNKILTLFLRLLFLQSKNQWMSTRSQMRDTSAPLSSPSLKCESMFLSRNLDYFSHFRVYDS